MNKKILFGVYGYGLGHATRCHAIINKLLKKNVEVKIAATDDAYYYFKKQGLNPTRINSFQISNIGGGFSWVQTIFENIDLPFNMIADYYTLSKVIEKFDPDVVISDSEPVSLYTAYNLKRKCAFLSNLIVTVKEYEHLPIWLKNAKVAGEHVMINAFMDRVLNWCDKVLSPTIASYKMSKKAVFTDLITRASPKDLPPAQELKKKLKIKNEFFLVSFGGAKIGIEYCKKILPVLKKIDCKFIISTNNAVRRYRKIGNLELHPFIDNFLEYLKCAEGAITLSGHSTLCENIVFGKPSFTIPIHEHVEQLGNASVIERKNYGKVYFIEKKINEERLLKKIKEFIEDKEYYARKVKASGFKGKGAFECANVLTSM